MTERMKRTRILYGFLVQVLILSYAAMVPAQVSGPRSSSEVKRIVYHRQNIAHAEGVLHGLPGGTIPVTSDVYVQDGPNGEARKLVQGGQDPYWSADAKRIAFLGFSQITTHQQRYDPTPGMVVSGDTVTTPGIAGWDIWGPALFARQIFVMNADGSEKKQITNLPNGVWDFAWSPIEQKIAYCESQSDGRNAIVVVKADGSYRQELTKMGEIQCAVGMPILQKTLDKDKTIVSSRAEGGKVWIKLVGPKEGTGAAEVATGELVGVPMLAWSPDGRWIAFTGVINGKPVIGMVSKDGGKPKALGLGYSAQWSPDGEKLLFRHDSNSNPPTTALCIVNVDGTQPRKILDNEYAGFGLTWFPDGKNVAFASERESKKQSAIFRINVDGSGLQKIASQPDMSLTNPVVSPDGGKLVFDAIPTWRSDSQMRDSNIWLLDLASTRRETLGKGSSASIFWATP